MSNIYASSIFWPIGYGEIPKIGVHAETKFLLGFIPEGVERLFDT